MVGLNQNLATRTESVGVSHIHLSRQGSTGPLKLSCPVAWIYVSTDRRQCMLGWTHACSCSQNASVHVRRGFPAQTFDHNYIYLPRYVSCSVHNSRSPFFISAFCKTLFNQVRARWQRQRCAHTQVHPHLQFKD